MGKAFSKRGLTPGLTYLGEAFCDVAGGLRRGAVDLHNLSLTLSIDLGKLVRWRGATVFLYGMGIAGRSPERYFGDLQGVSNIAAPGSVRLYEAWLQQDLWGGRLSLLGGIYDLNSEFDVVEAGSVFMSPSWGIDPTFAFTGLNGPSIFPNTTLGFRVRVKTGGLYAQAAVLNGLAGDPSDPDATRIILRRTNGVLVVAETGYHFPLAAGRHRRQAPRPSLRRYVAPSYAGKIALGLWTYTAAFTPILPGPGRIHGDAGLYVLLTHTIWHADGSDAGSGRRLLAFARLGLANPRINRLGAFVGGGLSFTGPFRGRAQDVAGVAVAAAFNGQDFLTRTALAGAPPRRAEWNAELTYQARILNWLDLHPDIQFVIHPGLAPSVRNALGFDLRVEVHL